MQKAKSRIKTPVKKKARAHKPDLSLKLSKKYLKHLPLLLLSLPFYIATYGVLAYIHPAEIKDFIIPNTYLPLQLVFFLGNFFLFSYLFLKTRRGLEMSILLSFTLFLKLQLISNYLNVSMGLLAIILVLEVSISLFKKD